MAKVHIIGAGLAGLAAAVKLAKADKEVILYESAAMAGGRCRSYFDTELGHTLDNGNHLILGANHSALAYIEAIGSHTSFISPRKPRYNYKDLATGEEFVFKPFWALTTLGKLAFASRHQTVAETINISSSLYRHFVDNFCTSVLNTTPADASAQMLRHVLWELLKCGNKGLRYYLPKESLSASLITPAIDLIKAHRGVIRYSTAIKSLSWDEKNISTLQSSDATIDVKGDLIILATPAHVASKLFPAINAPKQYNAIVNGHFMCPNVTLPDNQHFIGVIGGTAEWIFWRNGIISTTTSAANDLSSHDNNTIAQLLWQDICKALGFSAPLPPHRIITEKRATFAATPAFTGALQPQRGNLFLAGDYTVSSLPATIDSSVKSGFLAADAALKF